ncbi:MAG: hypothetical protein IPM93_30320 [Candidatus Obscuribacter sp.]|nr:hypothetical protein [Candidatus Obscuribacter sp.]
MPGKDLGVCASSLDRPHTIFVGSITIKYSTTLVPEYPYMRCETGLKVSRGAADARIGKDGRLIIFNEKKSFLKLEKVRKLAQNRVGYEATQKSEQGPFDGKKSTSDQRISQLSLDILPEKEVTLAFDGEDVSGNAGLLLVAQAEKLTKLLRGAAERLTTTERSRANQAQHVRANRSAGISNHCGVFGNRRQRTA